MEYQISFNKTTASRREQVNIDNVEFGKVYADHMFVADYKDNDWRYCRIVPYDKIPLSPATSALHYGQAIFEGMKAHKDENGNPYMFRPLDNFKRFNQSAQRMAMPEVPEEVFMGGLRELLKADKNWIPSSENSALYVRPYMFAADEYIGVRPADSFKFIIFSCPVGPYYLKPVKVMVTDKFVRAFPHGTGAVKACGNYGSTMLGVKEAQKAGYDQILWIDGVEQKYIQEIGTMNVFFVINGKVITPALDGTILSGITRKSVIQLLKDKGINTEERQLGIEEIYKAYKAGTLEDAFGTGTAATISHISDIGYKGENMKLPEVSERKYSNDLKKELEAIKTFQMKDQHNWMVKF